MALGRDIPAYTAPARPPEETGAAEDAGSVENPAGVITLRDALSLALTGNPELRAFAWDIRAKEAHALQAGLLPNPEASAEVENIGGSGPFRESGSAETTLRLSQLIELAGKRQKRARLAAFERGVAMWDYEAARIETLAKVTRAFVDTLAAQERLALAKRARRIAEQAFEAASERVAAGKAPPVDRIKARVELSISEKNLGAAEKALAASRTRLASMWGGAKALFGKVEGSLRAVRSIPSEDLLAKIIHRNPAIARWDVEMERHKAAVDLAEAKRIPDLTLEGGARRFEETGDSAFVAGVSMPIPIFDRNQGGYLEARFNLSRAKEEKAAAVAGVRAALASAYRDLAAAFEEAKAYKDEIIPGAEAAFDAASEGYRQGKFGYLGVLNAQRTLFDVRKDYINALAVYHKAAAEVERLTASPLDEAAPADMEKQGELR
ncbi:MAG: TolC family protein [Candidatus Nitrospinota bacterium M3_3B_026]